jgi:uncharacterized membrane protein
VWLVVGALVLGVVVLELRERRWARAAFWTIVAAPFVVGEQIVDAARAGTHWPARLMGVGVIALAVLARWTPTRTCDDDDATRRAREASAARHGNQLFVPVIAIAALTLAITRSASYLPIERAQSTLVAFAIACAVAHVAALALTRTRPVHGLAEARRLFDAVGWTVVLPMMLATLGVVFTRSGVGDAVARLVTAVIPTDNALACLLAYGLGMIGFTAIMGNAFAAFPVMTAGLGLPLIVGRHGGDPAALGAIGMVTGYCGTLLTPMAANFNLVPAALLELRDRYGVIRAVWPTAVTLIVANLAIAWIAVYR